MEVQQFGDGWNKLKDDPASLERIHLTDTTVRCSDGKCFQGVVHSIDPVSKSLLLARVEKDKVKDLVLCIGSAIEDVVACDQRSKYAQLVERVLAPEQTFTVAEQKQRQERLFTHLKTRNLPCDVDGKLIRISTWAHIEPPYTKKELFCTNEMIQERVSAILDEFVQDLHPTSS